MDVYFGVNQKESPKFTLNDLQRMDVNMINLIQTVYPCNIKYLNKCKTTRGTFMFLNKFKT